MLKLSPLAWTLTAEDLDWVSAGVQDVGSKPHVKEKPLPTLRSSTFNEGWPPRSNIILYADGALTGGS